MAESPIRLARAFGADEIDGVDFDKENGGAFAFRGVRIKDEGFSKGQRTGVAVGGILVEKVTECVSVGAFVCDGEEHMERGRLALWIRVGGVGEALSLFHRRGHSR